MQHFTGGPLTWFFNGDYTFSRKSRSRKPLAFREGCLMSSLASRAFRLIAAGTVLVLLTSAAAAQAVSLSPTSLSWTAVQVGQTGGVKPVTLTNNQSTSLTISGITVDSNFVQISSTCPISPATLPGGAACTVSVAFRPLAQGPLLGALTFADDAPGSPQSVGLSGTGTAGPLQYSPTSLTFPSTAAGTVSAAQTATLTNTTSSAITLDSISHYGQFAETSNCPPTLAANSSCTVSVTFNPTSGGSLTGGVVANYTSTTNTLFLSGTATGGTTSNGVTLSPKIFYTFPDQAVGSTSAPTTVTLTNGQAVPLHVSSVQLGAPFNESDNCVGTVAAGATCAITITYSPTAIGYTSLPLIINDDATSSPQQISINGNAFAPLTITPKGALHFSAQIVGRPSSPQNITVSNNQDASITINSVTLTGNDFVIANSCGNTLPGHSNCTISVSFAPKAAGFRSGSVTISHSAFGGPVVEQLEGNGIFGDTAVSVFVKPVSACALPSQSLQFTAQVTNNSNTTVSWYVDDVLNGNSDVGTISKGGLYTAPTSQSTHTIKAVNQSGVAGLGTVTVSSRPSYGINPFTASVLVSTDQPFQAQICSVPDSNNVTFSVDNIPGGNSSVGTVSSNGLYTAPATPGRHTVRVFDSALNRTSGAVVTVYSKVAVDFGARSNPIYPVPADLLGVNHAADLHNAADISLLAGAVSNARTYAQIPLVYATETPDWTKIDPQIASLQAAGMHTILQLAYTPPFLQPSPNPCGAGSDTAPPTDVNRWGQIAASYVAHMAANFPNVVRDYEIWNEPNTGAFCGKDKDAYFRIYAAAAPLMKQAAASLGATIRIGGPAVAGLDAPWITGLLSNPSTAQYVDFVSYHQYLYGGANREALWDTFNGTRSIYQRMQEPGDGVAAYFIRANGLLKAGTQPLGGHTPLFLDEYNVNYTFLPNCCSNDPVYSPVYNGLFVADLLNTVYSGSQEAPGALSYFAANAYPYFCLIGTRDSFMDCQYSLGSTPEPYPQYYLYQLLSSPTYLGLKDGAFLAPAVTPTLNGGGLAVSAFYTTTQNVIFIVNPTANNYQQLNIEAQNTGYTSAQGVLYQIVNGQSISPSSLPLTLSPGETTYTATISVPAYTVVAIGIQGTPDQSSRSIKAVVSATPEPSLYQAPFAVSATISALNGSTTPTGTVSFTVDGNSIGTAPLNNGVATLNENAIVFAGSHILTAAYSGDSNFDAATFSGTHVVQNVATTTTLQAAPNPATAGQPVVFTATVTAGGTPPPGQVTFTDDATEIGTGVLNASGVATFTTSGLAVGSHTITGTYTGQAQYGASSAFVVEEITGAALKPTTTTLASAVNPSQLGQSVTFTATVAGSGSVATGQVAFADGATQLGSATLDANGIATLTTSALAVGSQTITANYGGDTQFSASSGTLNQVVNTTSATMPTTTSLTSSPNPAQVGQSIIFTATVAASGGGATGTVDFLDNGTLLAQVPVNAQGSATFNTSALSAGTHTITAAYQGNPLFAQSTSSPVTQVVQIAGPGDFAILITPSRLSVVRGGLATYSVALAPIDGFSGIVDFTCSVGGAKLTTCSLDPTTLTGGGGTTLSVFTGAAHPTTSRNRITQTTLIMAGLFCCIFIPRKKLQSLTMLLVLAVAGITGVGGCGSNGTLGTPPGTYTITVTGTSTSTGTTITHTASAQLKIS